MIDLIEAQIILRGAVLVHHVSLERAVYRFESGSLWPGLPDSLSPGFSVDATEGSVGRAVNLEPVARAALHRTVMRFALTGLWPEHRVLFAVLLEGESFHGFRYQVSDLACMTHVKGKRTIRALERDGLLDVVVTGRGLWDKKTFRVTPAGVEFLEQMDGRIEQGHNKSELWPNRWVIPPAV